MPDFQPPPSEFIGKFCKICGLLASNHDGEREAAALKAAEMRRAAGLTWPDVLKPREAAANPAQQSDECSPVGALLPREMIAECLRWPRLLTAWQVDFLTNVHQRRHLPSEKQMVILRNIAEIFWRAGGFR